jgi:Ca2+-binding RTX toxin-like protein
LDASGWAFGPGNWTAIDLVAINASAGADTITGSSQRVDIFGISGSDQVRSGGGNDILTYSATPSAGGLLDGGDGFDTLGLIDDGGYNFASIAVTGIEALQMSGGTATFWGSQIRAGAIASVFGMGGRVDALVINAPSNTGAADLSAVAFSVWEPTDTITINGNTVANALVGSAQKDIVNGHAFGDTIIGGSGADTLRGDGGNDRFRYNAASEPAAGESVDGGIGVADVIEINSAGGSFDFSGMTVTAVEELHFLFSNATATLAGVHIGAPGRIATLRSAGANNLVVSGASIALTTVAFSQWNDAPGNDTITIDGTAGADQLFGSSRRDTINGGNGADNIGGNGGADVLNGGDGDDTFRYGSGGPLVAGESIDGGAGTDRIAFTFAGTLDSRRRP